MGLLASEEYGGEAMCGNPRVTVIAACYNHERFVEECLDSICAQNYPNLQLIITDDASTDGSVQVIDRWIEATGTTAEFICHRVNVGFPATLNEARLRVAGEFLTVIAADDLMEPGRLAAQVPKMVAAQPSVAAIYSDAWIIDETGMRTGATISGNRWTLEGAPEGNIFPELVRLNFIPAPSVLMRRSCLDSVGRYDESLIFEDWDIWLRLARQYQFCFAEEIGVCYRIVESSMYRTRRRELAVAKIRMLKKWIQDPLYGELAMGRLRQEIHHLYDLDRKESLPYLLEFCSLQPGLSSRARYLLARLGMRYRTQRRIVEGLSALRGAPDG